jgi:hypothetical protein
MINRAVLHTLLPALVAALTTSACGGDDTTTGMAPGSGGSNEMAGHAGTSSVAGGSIGASGSAGGGGGMGGGSAGVGGMPATGGGSGAPGADAAADGPEEGGAGAKSCDGMAVSFNANTGQGNDAAKAVVVVDFGNSTDLPTGNSNRTVEFWAYVLKSSWAGDVNTMFFYGTNNRVADGFGLDFGGGPGQIDPFTNAIFDNDNQPTGLDASKDQWVHFAMTWDGTAVRAFVNGMQKAMKTSSEAQKTLMTGRSPLYIGTYGSAYFNGEIDEFRLWNIARSEADIAGTMNKTLVGNEQGLVGYWRFDEKTGTMAADSVTTPGHQAHNGVLMAASPAQLPTWVPGVPLSCP